MSGATVTGQPQRPLRTIAPRDDVPPPGPLDDSAFRRAQRFERGDTDEPERGRTLFARLIERLGNPDNSLDRMLDTEAPRQEYLVDKIMPVREGGLIVGEGGAGKGMLQLLLALCLAAGISFGRFLVDQPRRVLLLNFEDNQEQLHRRLRSTAQVLFHLDAVNLGKASEWRSLIERNLKIASLRGEGARLDHDDLHDAIAAQAEVMGGIDWLSLDPLGRIAPEGTKFNSQEGAGEIHRQIDRLVERLGATVTVAHHVSKRGRSDKPGEDLEGASASGSQMLVDLARFEWRLVPMSGSDARSEYGVDHTLGYAALTVPKNNYGPRVMREEHSLSPALGWSAGLRAHRINHRRARRGERPPDARGSDRGRRTAHRGLGYRVGTHRARRSIESKETRGFGSRRDPRSAPRRRQGRQTRADLVRGQLALNDMTTFANNGSCHRIEPSQFQALAAAEFDDSVNYESRHSVVELFQRDHEELASMSINGFEALPTGERIPVVEYDEGSLLGAGRLGAPAQVQTSFHLDDTENEHRRPGSLTGLHDR